MSGKRVRESPQEAPPPKRKRAMDNSSSDQESDDDDDINLSQQPDFEYNATMGAEADVGIIEQVSLKNFMCHSYLEFKFCPQVNFIIGRNGSGKSAVLTSVVVGLGGKASATSRGSSVKSFIKTGKQSAEILVKLRNRGQDAYKPELYGRSIIVERRLSRDGASFYRLKNSDGQLVSTKREELQHILDSFNIQVDNPVAVLNQDYSRNFLHSKSAQDKYRFFLKATQLEQLKQDYVFAQEAKVVAIDVAKQKQQSLPSLEKEVAELEQKFKALAAVDGLKERVKALQDELAWAIVHKKEKDVDAAAKELRTEEARRPKYLVRAKQAEEKLASLMTARKDLETQIQDICSEASSLESRLKEAKSDANTAKRTFRDAQLEYRKASHDLDSTGREQKEILDRIEEIKNSAQQDYESERRLREEKILQLQEEVDQLTATKQATSQEQEQYQAAVNKYKEDHYRIQNESRDAQHMMDQLGRQIRDLEDAQNNRMKRFGRWMPDVLARIDDAHRRGLFHKKPRGPVGANLNLLDPSWALAVESCIKSLIHAFCVDDHHDEKQLEAIFKQACPEGRKPSTITSAFQDQIHNVSAYRAQTKYSTVLDLLSVDDPVITNCLIDQRGIENILLIADNEEARQVMSSQPPRNVREAFTKVGDQLYCMPIYRYYSSNVDKPQYLSSNVEENIRHCKSQRQNIQAERQRLGTEEQSLLNEIKKNTQQDRACQTRVMKLNSKISKLNFELSELKDKEDPAPVDVTTLEEEAKRFTAQLADQSARKDQSEGALAVAKQTLIAAEEVHKGLEGRLSQMADSTDPFKAKIAVCQSEIEVQQSHKRHYDQKKKDHEKKIEEARTLHEKLKTELETDSVKAETICPRKRTRRTPENIDSEIQQIQKQIKVEQKNRGNDEEITRQFHESLNCFKKIKQEVQQLNNFLTKLDMSLGMREKAYNMLRSAQSIRVKLNYIRNLDTRNVYGKMEISHKRTALNLSFNALDEVMEHRQNQYFEFRKMIAIRAKYFFIVMLSNRKYSGKMTFNHQKELLTLSVQPNTAEGEGTRDMKSLSGGERSFATVCFILALWDAMESPFRWLDEFDVFMDLVNRRIAMEMMMNVATQQKGRQFIFLTPLDMSQVNLSNKVRVYRMPDPDRGQGVLNFRPANAENEEDDEQPGPSSRN